MKCPTCESCEYAQYCGATEIMRKCERHNKKVNMTNEEWFASLPTTEKSSFLAKMVTEAIKEHGKCGATRCESSIWWDEWLKQPKE